MIDSNIFIGNMAGNWISGGGIWIYQSSTMLTNNLFIDNFACFGGAIACGGADFYIANNTIYHNHAGSGGGISISLDEDDTLINNIIWGNTAYVDCDNIILTGDSSRLTYSDIEGGWPGEGNIDADPLFCDPEGDDFYLAENSPCVGTGFNGANIGAFGIGCDSVGIYDEPYLIPELFSLSPNYPNPFNAATTIKYTLPKPADITIDIYNLLGRKVETLIDGIQPAGAHSVIWEAEGFSSGIYFYKLTAGDYSQTQRMMLLK